MCRLVANRLLRLFEKHKALLSDAGVLPPPLTPAKLLASFGEWVLAWPVPADKPLSMRAAAAARCRAVANCIRALIAKTAEPHLLPGLVSVAAFFIDLHVPLMQASPEPATVFAVYRRRLAPESHGDFPVAVGPPFPPPCEEVGMALANAWAGGAADALHPARRRARPNTKARKADAAKSDEQSKNGPRACALFKLLRKCARPPASIRYINPQADRCVESGGFERDAMRTIITAGKLCAYVDCTEEEAVWKLEDRAAIYAGLRSDEQLRGAIAAFPTKTLFSVVRRYLRCATMQFPAIWRTSQCIVEPSKGKPSTLEVGKATAAKSSIGCDSGAAASRRRKTRPATSLKIPSDITKACTPATLRTALLAPSRDEAKKALARHGLPDGTASALLLYAARHQAVLHVAQLPASTAALQKRAVEARTGIRTVPVAICRVCTTVHAKVAGAATPVKKRSGIMMEIEGDGAMRPGRCAACGTSGCIDVVDAVGKEIRARVRHSDAEATTIMVCAECGILSANTVNVDGVVPACRACAAAKHNAPWAKHTWNPRLCPCGAAPATLSNAVIGSSRQPQVCIACPKDAGGVRRLPVCTRHAKLAAMLPPNYVADVKWVRKLFLSKSGSRRGRKGGAVHLGHRRRRRVYCGGNGAHKLFG